MGRLPRAPTGHGCPLRLHGSNVPRRPLPQTRSHLTRSRLIAAIVFATAAAWAAGSGSTWAQGHADARDPSYLLEADVQSACDNPATAAQPPVPSGWTFHRPAGSSAAQLRCGPAGLGISDPGGGAFLYNANLSRTGSQPLVPGRYLLSGAGAGTVVLLRNGFGDFSHASRTRILNLKATASIVNMVEVTWESGSDNGLLEVWGTGLKWLRLERMPDRPPAPRTFASAGAAGHSWTLAEGTVLRVEGDGVRLSNPSPAAARVEQTFVLPPGRYELRSLMRGNVDVQLSSGPTALRDRFNLVDEPSRSALDQVAVPVAVRFTATGQPVTLRLAAAHAGQEVVVHPVEIRPLVEAVLTPPQRAAQRPVPWPARGMGVTEAFDLLPDTRPPRDRGGAACARSPQAWATSRDWPHRSDLVDLRRLGANLIRLDVRTVSRAVKDGCRLVDDNELPAAGRVTAKAFWSRAWPVILQETAAVVQAAGAAGLKVVLLMEPSTPTQALNEQPDGWADPQARRDFVRGWREMAAHLSPLRQHVWAYELFNEPHEFVPGRGNVAPSQWRHLAIDTVAAIRSAEQGADAGREPSWVVYAPVLQPSDHWAAQYAQGVLLPDERVIYTEHYYDAFSFTHQNICQQGYPAGSLPYTGSVEAVRAALRPLREFAQSSGAPVYVGEFSAAVWAGWSAGERGIWQPRRDAAGLPVLDNVNWLRDVLDALEADGLAWTYHSFRTYYAWNPELIVTQGPCGPFEYQRPGQPDTPTMRLLGDYLQRNSAPQSTGGGRPASAARVRPAQAWP